jgi:hypothetical protein
MVELVYELAQSWPEQGPLLVTVPSVTMKIPVSPDAARRRANGYLGMHVGLLLGASDPQLLLGEHPMWKLSVNLHLPGQGYVGRVGTIAVDAITGDVAPLSEATIRKLQERAHDLIGHFPSPSES